MSADGLARLLDAATADVPPRHQGVPLAAINRRIRRRRAWAVGVAGAATVAVLLGGFAVAHAVLAAPPGPPVIAPTQSQSPAAAALPWVSVFVARDDRTVTVYSGADRCRELVQSRAQVTAADAGHVVIAVYGQIVNAADCSTTGHAVPVVLTLPSALGTRQVSDATGGSRPLYHERDLPELPAGWTPIPQVIWSATDAGWYTAYDGPRGAVLQVSAGSADAPGRSEQTVTTVRLGARQGTVTSGNSGLWRVWWLVGTVRYELMYEPSEGGTFTLNEFKSLLASLSWS